MKIKWIIIIICVSALNVAPLFAQMHVEDFPNAEISNDQITMKLLLPDPEKGAYRATRFDWSGVVASLQYKGHEYFGYWKKTHDPQVHEDLSGPVESYNHPGLGYAEAEAGEGFIRIGVGILEKPDEKEYRWSDTYKIVDHGKWSVKKGKDWIEFRHKIKSDFGYAYIYKKRIKLKQDEPGFVMIHSLKNRGVKAIRTDQYNHNFFMIDGKPSGPGIEIHFPFNCTTIDDLKGLMKLDEEVLSFTKHLKNNSIWMELTGYGPDVDDHAVSMVNRNSGAGVRFKVDKPLHRMVFWACETTYCPENFILLNVEPGEEEKWISNYTLFIEEK
jgi:hypothetical protein